MIVYINEQVFENVDDVSFKRVDCSERVSVNMEMEDGSLETAEVINIENVTISYG